MPFCKIWCGEKIDITHIWSKVIIILINRCEDDIVQHIQKIHSYTHNNKLMRLWSWQLSFTMEKKSMAPLIQAYTTNFILIVS